MIRYSVSVALLVLAHVQYCRAELIPTTDVTYCSDRAELVVVGKLDAANKLTINRVLNKVRMDVTEVKIDPSIGQSLRSAMGAGARTPVEVIAFLDQQDRPVLGVAGVVGISETGVYVLQEGPFERQATHSLHATFTRTTFLNATELAIANSKLRRTIEAMPASSDRTRKALAFLSEHKTNLGTEWWPNYHLGQLAKSLTPVHRDEEVTILEALESSETQEQRVMLLNLIGSIPLTQTAFEPVAKWIGREHDADSRQMAVTALARINNYEAAERIIPLLSLDDSQLRTMLTGLSQRRDSSDHTRNPRAVDALLKLTTEMRKRHKLEGRHVLQNESYQLLATLQDYFHPQMLQPLLDWALEGDHSSSNQALANLQMLTDVKFIRENSKLLMKWWKEASPILTANYDLDTEAGLSVFLDRYNSADKQSKSILNRLWRFERNIAQQTLLRKAESPDVPQATAAKSVLSTLWQERMLSPAGKKQIVKSFLRVEFVELPRTDDRHELRLIAHRDFPFPQVAWIQPNSDWAIAPRKPNLRDSWGSQSLYGQGPITLGSYGTGSRRGSPTAIVNFALREVDHRDAGKVLWSLRWDLALQLRQERK